MAGAAASAPIAFSGLCAGISVAVLLSSLSQPPPGAADGAQAAQLDPAVHAMVAAVAATFFAAITIIYVVHLHNGGGGNQRITEMTFLILCASMGLMDLSLCMQPGPVQAPVLLRAAAVQLLPYAGAATFYLAVMLTCVHVSAAGAGDGAGNERYRAAVEFLNTVTFAATLFTGVLGSITAALVFSTK